MAGRDNKTKSLWDYTRQQVLNGRYRIDKCIGMGGMAEVYRGVDTLLNREVAIKLLLPEYAQDPAFAQQFQTEAQAAAQLRGSHIVGVYDVGDHEGRRYIVMELVHGVDLKQVLAERRILSPRVVATIAMQTCEGLEEAHTLGIIHRDIKSANIMVQRKQGMRLTGAIGEELSVKIMDFGIAQTNAIGRNGENESIMGSIHYISPERIDGMPAIAASDLYSLGIVMYEAATGRLPFDAASQDKILEKHLRENPIPPRNLNPGIDDDLNDIIMQALNKDPAARYASAVEMHQTLGQYLLTESHPSAPKEYPRFWVLGFTRAPANLQGTMHKINAPVVIGRADDADITIQEETVSRKHARITPMGLYLEVEDLGSSNGTIVDGESAEHSTILCKAGSCIELGVVRIVVGAAR